MSDTPETPPPEWSRRVLYKIAMNWRNDEPYKGGTMSKALCMVFALLAIAAGGWAELNWQGAMPVSGNFGIGIGTSGYATTLYLRAVALAAISMAFGIAHLAFRIPVAPRISLKSADVEKHPQAWERI